MTGRSRDPRIRDPFSTPIVDDCINEAKAAKE